MFEKEKPAHAGGRVDARSLAGAMALVLAGPDGAGAELAVGL
jgi:hypothetical protein